MKQNLQLSQVSRLQDYSTEYSRFGDDYVYYHITDLQELPDLDKIALQPGGMIIVLCRAGSIELQVNLSPVRVVPNSLLVVSPDSICNVKLIGRSRLDLYVLEVSTKFIRDVNFDVNVLSSIQFSPHRTPLLSLAPDEMKLLLRYISLIHYNTLDNIDPLYVRSISRNLAAALIYQLMLFGRRRLSRPLEEAAGISTRKSAYVREFLKLVYDHHGRERGVAFYADILCISPKYLSLVVKESTGRSAAQWIDDYVILEAKNLLRFSGLNVQQVAYKLNFPNQSAFGKYFKHLTGMSPTEYQRS